MDIHKQKYSDMEDIPSYTQYPPTKIRHLTKDVRNISSTRASGILDLSAKK